MFGIKKKQTISIELNDYILKALIRKGESDEFWEVFEHTVPVGTITDTSITDEMNSTPFTEHQLLEE